MKTLLTFLSLAVLAGCAYPPPGPPNYGTRIPAPADPGQWHVVSVTPVAPGTGERLGAEAVRYYSAPTAPAEPAPVAQPVYVPQPVYVAPPYSPYYYAPPPYYYPPVSISLGFAFGRGWGGHHHHHRGGIAIGSRWHR